MTHYGLPEMIRHTGASARQIDHWTSQGYLRCPDGSGSGHARHWPAVERDIARLMIRLTKTAGFSPSAAAYLARMLATTPGDTIGLGNGLTLTVTPPSEGYAALAALGAPEAAAADEPGRRV